MTEDLGLGTQERGGVVKKKVFGKRRENEFTFEDSTPFTLIFLDMSDSQHYGIRGDIYEHSLCAQQCPSPLHVLVNLFKSHKNALRDHECPQFMDEETKARSADTACPGCIRYTRG